jgi:23S rRNA (cytidine1920-2'-O)/16S rRNA (cytidine1409-2'-O)-methyltransferase
VTRPQSPLGRAHDKLGLALVHFKQGHALKGVRVLDVSGSTPGFTALALERGAAHVASLDLGPTPLAPKLRADPRVSFVERVNPKSLPASSAPGPFEFFTVDLRFAAARQWLRAIAFRLGPEAQGVVWLKPRFEVPAEQVKASGLEGLALREAALALFGDKATSLGFQLAAIVEGSGGEDGEIMIHLAYRRPAPRAR